MGPISRRALLGVALLLVLPAMPVVGEPLRAVLIRGVKGDELANVEATLSLRRLPKRARADLSEGRLSYLLRRASDEVSRALQPYGYYDATVASEITRDARGITVTLTVTPGSPVIVAESRVGMEGPARADRQVEKTLQAFLPRIGRRLDHRLYEASKLAVQRRLLERGYFDAELIEHRIEVRQRALEALLLLRWQSGPRYRFGAVQFEGSQVDAELLRKTIPFEPGEPYHQRELLALQQRLTDLDYFGYIDVRPESELAEGTRVPIAVAVTPGKRSVYTAGVSYGTDSGAGVQLGLERRWLNSLGHKLRADLDFAQRRKVLGVLYRIPAFEWAEGWYAIGASLREEDSESVSTRITELAAQRTGRWRGLNLGVGLHLRKEKFQIGQERTVQQGEQRLVYPALSVERKQSDDALYPRKGFLLRAEVKVGARAIGSEIDFGQLLFDAKLIRGFGERHRLLIRGQLGRTVTREFNQLPPSLRFFAGGDRSIRGYGYQEVGPRLDEQVIGGKHLLVGSVEFERMFNDTWGAAVFADAGDAFSDKDAFRAHLGVGAGVRWRSPVGLVRLDLAHGVDDADNVLQIHINIGPDL